MQLWLCSALDYNTSHRPACSTAFVVSITLQCTNAVCLSVCLSGRLSWLLISFQVHVKYLYTGSCHILQKHSFCLMATDAVSTKVRINLSPIDESATAAVCSLTGVWPNTGTVTYLRVSVKPREAARWTTTDTFDFLPVCDPIQVQWRTWECQWSWERQRGEWQPTRLTRDTVDLRRWCQDRCRQCRQQLRRSVVRSEDVALPASQTTVTYR